MVDIILSSLGLLVSFYFLHFITEFYFIPSLDKLAKKLRMSSDMAGATLMAAGSSAPELAVMLFAIFIKGDHEAIGIGTIVGSALFNLLVIVGVVMILGKSKMIWQPLLRDLIFYGLSVVLIILFFSDGHLTQTESLIFLSVYIFYIIVMFLWQKHFPYEDIEQQVVEEDPGVKESGNLKERFEGLLHRFVPKVNNTLIAFLLSVVIISGLSWLLVHFAVDLSVGLNIQEVFIGLTVIAMGTSVPDLLSSAITAKQGRSGMAINNAIGSNVFDILIGIGFPFLLLSVIENHSVDVISGNLWVSFALLFGSVIILAATFLLNRWRTSKVIGSLLIVLYIVYLVYEILKIY